MNTFQIQFPQSPEAISPMLRNPGASVLNGGTDLMVQMRIGKKTPSTLVSLERMPSLNTIIDQGNAICIGCRVTFADLIESPLIRESFPILVQASLEVGSAQIRNRATLVGNTVNASPAGDGILALVLLEAQVEIHGGSSSQPQHIPAEAFITAPGKTVLQQGQWVHSITIPKPAQGSRQQFVKVGKRKAMAISIASMGSIYQLENNVFSSFRLGFGSVAPKVIRIEEAETFAIGKPLNQDTLKEIGAIVRKHVNPIDDVRATAQYRKDVCEKLVLKI